MSPVRRYIRLTAHTTLLTLIFLEDPADVPSWLLHPTQPALPRIVDSLRGLLLPKLREERDRDRKNAKKNKNVKDTVVGSDFEVNVFLTEGGQKHALLTKQRVFNSKTTKLKSNSTKLAVGSSDATDISILKEEDPDAETVNLSNVPLSIAGGQESDPLNIHDLEGSSDDELMPSTVTRTNRKRKEQPELSPSDASRNTRSKTSDSRAPIQVESESEDETQLVEPPEEEKKKFLTKYDGFTIYGKVLYMLVKRIKPNTAHEQVTTSEGIMEEWMQMSQVVREAPDE